MGKNISVLGDSISTFQGYSNNVIDQRYPGIYYPCNDVNSVEKTWWWNVSVQLGGRIVSNDSIAGSCVAGYNRAESDHSGQKWCMNNQLRINDLGESNVSSSNHPDIIMFFGGINDVCQDDFNNETFINSYSNAVRMMFERYSNKITILCITPYATERLTTAKRNLTRFQQACSGIALVVNLYRNYGYDCKLISLQDIELQDNEQDVLGHPTKAGMDRIADRVAYVQQHGY